MSFKHLLYILTLILSTLSLGGFAQEDKSFHVDSTGRLFVNPSTPVYLYISTTPDGSDAVRLRSLQPEGEPMQWGGHGFLFLTHLNLYLGRNIQFDLFADGHPPKTSVVFNVKEGYKEGLKIFLSGSAFLELQAIDPFSGVQGIFYSVNDSEFDPYTKPIEFDKDGEYSIQFYAIDNVGNKEDEGKRIIIIDSTPPVTTLGIEGSHHNEVLSSKTKISLTASDAFGVKETFYAINNGSEIRYNRQINISNLPEGNHSISWYSVDMVGNIEEKQAFDFFVDRTPPMVFEEIMGNTFMVAGREYSSGRSQLRIAAVDNKAGVKEIFYSINNAPFKLYEKPIFLSEISGAITIRSYAIDNVDNKGTSDAEGQLFSMPEVDITGPNIRHFFTGKQVSLRDTLWISPETKINLIATDRGSGVSRIEYRLNDSSSQQYSKPFEVPESGYYSIAITAWDNVENLNIGSFSFGVDAQAPQVFYHFSVKPNRFSDEDGEMVAVYPQGVILYLGATDDIVGVDQILVSVNEARERAYNQPLSEFKANQTHTITIRAIDKLGNEQVEILRIRVE